MFYKLAILEMCDECRLTLLKDPKISGSHILQDMSTGKGNSCEICGRVNRFTMAVLTDYRLTCDTSLYALEQIDRLRQSIPRSVPEGFLLLSIEDELERAEIDKSE